MLLSEPQKTSGRCVFDVWARYGAYTVHHDGKEPRSSTKVGHVGTLSSSTRLRRRCPWLTRSTNEGRARRVRVKIIERDQSASLEAISAAAEYRNAPLA